MNKFLLVLSSALVMLQLSGCVEDLTADEFTPYQVIASGSSAQSDEKRLQIITSQPSYDAVFYQLLNRSGTPETIDFSQYQVLLIMPGAVPYNFSVAIQDIRGLDNQVNILLTTQYAAANCVVPAVLQQNWQLIMFPKVSKPALLSEQASFKAC